MTDAVSAGQGGLARRAEAELQLARAGDGGQSGRVEGGGGAVIRKAGDRASEAERPRGRDFFRPPPGAKDGIDRLRRGGIGRGAGESKSENEQRWASDPRLRKSVRGSLRRITTTSQAQSVYPQVESRVT